MSHQHYDAVVIGAGVVGCAVARDLSRYEMRTILLEANSDLCDGASKGNSALLVSGYDLDEGTMECELVRRGHERYLAEAPSLGLPIRQIGAMTLAWTDGQADQLARLHARATAAGRHDLQLVKPDAVYDRSQALGAGLVAALWAPSEAIVDPFSTVYAYALDAWGNGVEYRSHSPVLAAQREGKAWCLSTPEAEITGQVVVNCAGLAGDRVDALAGFSDFKIRPIRGQYLLFDKSAGDLLDFIALPTPTATSRGILLTPTIFGNLLVGPTAEPLEDAGDSATTADGIEALSAAARRVIPSVFEHAVTISFAGVRPGSDARDYRIIERPDEGWVTIGGIRSTGLSGSLAIAEHVAHLIVPSIIEARRKRIVFPVSVPDLSAEAQRPWATPSADLADHEIVCHCEGITLGEIERVLASPLPPRSRKALKRRTRAMFGRCQGFYCGARIERLFLAAEASR
jgi:glycerol-3-phosphate dehydrogenase